MMPLHCTYSHYQICKIPHSHKRSEGQLNLTNKISTSICTIPIIIVGWEEDVPDVGFHLGILGEVEGLERS